MLKPLANAIEAIHKASQSDVILEALWAGDKSEKEEDKSIKEVIELIENNKFGNKVRYKIRK